MGCLKWKGIPALLFFLFFLGTWQMVVTIAQVPLWLLPTPAQIAKALWETRQLIWMHTLITLVETTVGFALAVVFSLITAGVMVLSPWLKRLLYPFLIISQTVPLIAVAPLLILWLGYGLLPKIMIVIIVCFFPVTISLIEGLELTDADLLNLLRSMGASRWQMFYIVRWPNALPSLFAGLKIAATYSVMGAVIAEWLGSSSGLGVYLTRSSHSFLTDRVFAAIFTITALSFLYYALITLLARLALPWIHSKNQS
ncbi:ABC transporter permease [Desulfosporosinus sp. BICA1-9]|uniref:ABC transporter permease n=1 Tax=Desulfosporosinus sp. BICA1-9 TaxID=1531958 RepID=UPI00054BC7F8|nr:ABC transporter permease [Desulfosporosinus sp. BICA1-9]KJS50421.1 MAG: ABC transporter permease [Peptococcaceae bacterium BRH_c23]KJS82255.1 MAG: ABC transporter permease [Desulfosporosinus sp. BICA1-9]KJS88995.1 MAG: ABC transporter permease [Desulfosporosinus sp. BICA1-9]HBW37987.1 ABC transporter permease [Desulfosporosinus sp.]